MIKMKDKKLIQCSYFCNNRFYLFQNGEWCVPCSLSNILLLCTHSVHCLSENQPEYKLATLMVDACTTLQDMQS